jgi:hypothetical protein
MATDPYAAPRSRVADVPARGDEGNFIPDGQAVPAGNGWKWITDGWALFKRQPGMWILIVIALVLISLLLGLIPLLGSVASNLLMEVFVGGIMLGCRELDRGGELEFGHLFAGFRDHFGKLILVSLCYLAALVVIVFVAFAVTGVGIGALMGAGGGVANTTILLAALVTLALLIPVAMAIWFAPALVVLNDFGIVDAFKTSFMACLKNIVPFLLYGVILFGFAIVASIPLFLGWLVLVPVVAASVYTAYRDIFYAG